ncbi:hypothetical protein HMPREF1979_00499 [Actinomyces johnsonii F0542]|uniref:Uncharacterized protein n=1 Tax=Actinomyces johnsonii F0542 TaxID=1321818 RepID=U1S0M2_9ACTO|nr:hypothetical protein HMPREF1979_00499 [Actinomyces johnsonii F0542]
MAIPEKGDSPTSIGMSSGNPRRRFGVGRVDLDVADSAIGATGTALFCRGNFWYQTEGSAPWAHIAPHIFKE